MNSIDNQISASQTHDAIKPYICHICSKGFVQSPALKLHLNVHNKVRFHCDLCPSSFSEKRTLKMHMIKCRLGIAKTRPVRPPRLPGQLPKKPKPCYKCFAEGCDRTFTIRTHLGKHLEKIHNMKYENFSTTCLICQMEFDSVGEHLSHVKIHTCNYVCEICKKRLKTVDMLQSHMDKVHKEGEDDRPFTCHETNCGARL